MGHNVFLPSFGKNTCNKTDLSTLYSTDCLWSVYCMLLKPPMENLKREFCPTFLATVITQFLETLILFNDFHLDIMGESFTYEYFSTATYNK